MMSTDLKIAIETKQGRTEVPVNHACAYVAAYLSWARQGPKYKTLMPMVSYRGHSSVDWKLLPTLCRQVSIVEASIDKASHPSSVLSSWLKQIEHEIIVNFRSKFDLRDWSTSEVLAFARHHGAPTRLLDWSTNPFIGLWFAVSDKNLDSVEGVVYQFAAPRDEPRVTLAEGINLESMDNPSDGPFFFVFTSPARIPRSERQRSVFTIATFQNDYALKPLDEAFKDIEGAKNSIQSFPVPAACKAEIRRLLSDLSLDAFSIYGDPDSYGKALSYHFDLSDLKLLSNARVKTQSE